MAAALLFLKVIMANTKAALKYSRRTQARELQNRQIKSRLRTLRKKVDDIAASGDASALDGAVRGYTSALDKAGKRNLVHRNKIAREKAHCGELLRSAG